MKIDVEGAEHLVLQGARRTLRDSQPVVLVEVHSTYCMYRTLAILTAEGYGLDLLHVDDRGRCFLHGLPRTAKTLQPDSMAASGQKPSVVAASAPSA